MKKISIILLSLLMSSTLLCAATVKKQTNNKNLSKSKLAIKTLNSNWYSQHNKQWMENQNKGFVSAWHSFNILEQLIDYTNITGDKTYMPIINSVAYNSQLNAQGVLNGNDDMEWEAISLLKMYKINKDPLILFEVKEIFKKMAHHYWDNHCNGGVWWQPEKKYKNAITNELYLVLATDLYAVTKDKYYLNWAIKEWKWFKSSGLINSKNLINDGLNYNTCKNNGETTWTYNQGVILGGLANLFIFTGNDKYLNQANKIADAVINNLTKNGILVEPGKVNSDRAQFKGVFIRYLAYLTINEKNITIARKYKTFINKNANYVWSKRGENNKISYYWEAPEKNYSAVSQSSAIDLFNAQILVNSKIN
ncbi:MAG: glycosyl hydrolase [bacterium]|nr:glycosyl hydrolase [bacterium]